jgi:hypothetical protein
MKLHGIQRGGRRTLTCQEDCLRRLCSRKREAEMSRRLGVVRVRRGATSASVKFMFGDVDWPEYQRYETSDLIYAGQPKSFTGAAPSAAEGGADATGHCGADTTPAAGHGGQK